MKIKRKIRVLLIGIIMLTSLVSFLVYNKVENKKYAGKIKVENVEVKKSTDNKKEINKKDNDKEEISEEAKEDKTDVVEAYSRQKYIVNYTLKSEDNVRRNAIVRVKISEEDSKFVSFIKKETENVTSSIIENGKVLELRIKDVQTNTLQREEIELKINNAPDGYKVSPIIEVLEETSEKEGKTVSAPSIEVKTTSISGIVINKETKETLKNVEVVLFRIENGVEKKEKSTSTDENGKYVFSDLIEGSYKVKSLEGEASVEVTEGNTPVDVESTVEEKFSANIKKYVKEIVIKENGNEKKYTFEEAKKAVASIKGNTKAEIEIEYSFLIENISSKKGYVKVIKENIPEGFEKANEDDNWVIDGDVLYNKQIGREKLEPKEKKELTLRLKSTGKVDAKEYVNKVSLKGEEYHTVKYVIDEEVVKEITVVDTDKVEEIEYSKEKEELEGWYKDKEFKEKFDFNVPIERDTIIYGNIISDKEIKVHYIDRDVEIKTEEVKRGEKLNAPKEVEEENHYEGHIFKHWSLEKNGSAYNLEKGTKKEITLYAVYDKKEYKVEYYDEKENGYEKISEETVKYEENLKKVPNVSKRFYTFIGWKEEDKEIINVKSYKVTKDVKLYALYEEKEYIIEFYDGDKKLIEESKYKASQIVNEPETKKENYTFVGWETKEGKKVKIKENNRNYFAIEVFEENNLEGNEVKLYAKYERSKYTVSFVDINPRTLEEKEVHSEEVNYKETVKELPNVEKENYNFLGWTLERDNKEKIVENIKEKEVLEDTTYYAIYEIKKYKMTFIDKEEKEESILDAGSIVVEKEPNTENGYNFLGWYKGEEKVTFPITLLEDTTVEAKYEKKKYEVKFIDVDPNTKEEKNLDTIEVEHGSLVYENDKTEVVKQDNYKEGYVFKEWIDSENNSFDFTKKITSNETIYSSYTKIKNGVIFDDENRITEKEVEYGEKIEEINSQGKKGHTFKFWSEDKTSAFDFNTEIKESKRLYAVYERNTYTLRVNPNGGEFDGNTEVKEYELEYEEEKEISNPSKKGYTFTGWEVSVENVYSDNKIVMPDSDVTLTAKYKKNTYTLRVDPNGGEYEGSTEIKEYELEYEEEKEIIAPNKEGYTFTGWTVSVENVFNDNKIVMPDTDVTLTANYNITNHTLTIDPNGGEYKGDSTTYTLNYNEEKIVEESEKEGYTFVGYKVISGNGIYNEDRRFQMKTEDTVLEAIYRENTYTVKYTAENATGTMGSDEFRFTEVKKLSKNLFIKEGYTFTGWIDEETNEEYVNEEEVYSLRKEDKAVVTLKAKFEANKYKVVYNKCDELVEGTMEDSEFTYDEIGNLRKNAYTKQGFDFKGWSLKETEGIVYQDEEEVINLSSKNNETIELCAVFEEKEYKVTYIDESEEYFREFVKYGKTAKGPKNAEGETLQPSKEGKEFIGWFFSLEDENSYNFENVIIEDITLYAKYTEMEIPEISQNPNNWTNDKVEITISTKEEYVTEYKIVNENIPSEYIEYTNPFIVEENVIIKARYKKKNEYSNEASHEVKNIDKINPILEEEKIELVDSNYNDVSISIKTKDENSRVKNIKVYLDENNDEIGTTEEKKCEEIYNIPGDFANPGEEEKSYICKIDNLVESTSYKVIIEVEDFAGNKSKQIKEVETGLVVADIVYIENDESITEENSIPFGKLQEAFTYCENNKCTVRMLVNTKEKKTVTVSENQDIKLNLNGKTISSDLQSSTIENNGKLQIVDENNEEGESPIGKIENTVGVGVKNTLSLIIGNNEAENEDIIGSVVSELEPYISGGNYGIVSDEGTSLKFYDGKLEGSVAAVNGAVTGKPYLYNVQITSGERQVAILKILQEAEARVKRSQSYYTKVSNALTSTNNGITEEKEEEENLISDMISYEDAEYGFKEEIESRVTLKDLSKNNSNAYSTTVERVDGQTGITFDGDDYILTNERLSGVSETTYETTFEVNKFTDNQMIMFIYDQYSGFGIYLQNNKIVGQANIGETTRKLYYNDIKLNTKYNVSLAYNGNGLSLYVNGDLADKFEGIGSLRDYGDSYFLTLGANTYNTPPTMYFSGTIYSARVYDKGLTEEEVKQNNSVSTEIYKTNEQIENVEGFVTDNLKLHYETKDKNSVYSEEKNVLVNTNKGVTGTIAQSYMKIDLRNYEKNQMLKVNAEISSYSSYGAASVTETEDKISVNSKENFIDLYNQNLAKDYYINLNKGKVYYLHIAYYNPYMRIEEGVTDTFKINSISLTDAEDEKGIKLTTPAGESGFTYMPDGSIINQRSQCYSGTSHTSTKSYIEYDLTNSETDKVLNISTTFSGSRYAHGYVALNESTEYNSSDNIISVSDYYSGIETHDSNTARVLKKGKKYYLHLYFQEEYCNVKQYFKINYISLSDINNTLEEKELHTTYGEGFILNTPIEIEDLSLNNNEAVNYNAIYDEENEELKFNGNSGITLGKHNYKNITYETSFKINDLSKTQEIMATFNGGGCGIFFDPNVSNSIGAACSFESEWKYLYYRNISANTRYDTSITYDGKTFSLYVNGELADNYDTKEGEKIKNTETLLTLGTLSSGSNLTGTNSLNGTIYSARAYDRALTKDEINSNINNENKIEDNIIFNYDFKLGKSITKGTRKQYEPNSKEIVESYVEIDLTNEVENKLLTVGGYSTGRGLSINLGEDVNNLPQIFYKNTSGTISTTALLQSGKKYYLKFYADSSSNVSNVVINQLELTNLNKNGITLGEEKQTVLNTNDVPKLNEEADTVELLKNIDLTTPITVENTRKMILDLRGYTLTTNSTDYVIKNYGDLEVIDSKYTKDIANAKEKYEEEKAQNQIEYEEALAKYEKDKQDLTEKYNQKYSEDLNKAIEEDKKQEEINKNYEEALEEYNNAHLEYDYTGDVQEFIAPKTGLYKLETWGAQGGTTNGSTGGYGGYSKGTVNLEKGDKLYVYVGSQGQTEYGSNLTVEGGYNGGGSAHVSETPKTIGSGGGATHIAKSNLGELYNYENSQTDLLIVSGGGGGSLYHASGYRNTLAGNGGGYKGSISKGVFAYSETYDGKQLLANGGTQEKQTELEENEYVLGLFGKGSDIVEGHDCSGAGGGFYGGNVGVYTGGGGSGYIGNEELINKEMYCYNCEESNEENTKTISTTNVSETPKANYSKEGNGHAKISLLNDDGTEIKKPINNSIESALPNMDGIKDYFDYSNYSEETWSNSLSGNNMTIYGTPTKLEEGLQLNARSGNYATLPIDNSGSTIVYMVAKENVRNGDSRFFEIPTNPRSPYRDSPLVYINGNNNFSFGSYSNDSHSSINAKEYAVVALVINNETKRLNMYINGNKITGEPTFYSYGNLMYLAHTESNDNAQADCTYKMIAVINKLHSEKEIKENSESLYKFYIEDNNTVGIEKENNRQTFKDISLTENSYNIDLEKEKTITNYKIYGSSSESTYPSHVEILGSNDNVNFEKIDESDLSYKLSDEYNEININKNNLDSYRYYKLKFTSASENINIDKIELKIFDIKRQRFEAEENIDITKENFANKIDGSGNAVVNEDKSLSLDIYSGTSMLYYKEKSEYLSASGSVEVWNNSRDVKTGELYIGFATTNEPKVDDFVEYTKIDIDTVSNKKTAEFNIKVPDSQGYYFKIVNKSPNSYRNYATIKNLKLVAGNNGGKLKPVLKEAVLADSTLTGNITSTTGNLIYNDRGANLKISQGYINVNKDGISGIRNNGNLILEDNGIINVNAVNSKGIFNLVNGTIETKNNTINLNPGNQTFQPMAYGIYDISKNQENYKDLNIYMTAANAVKVTGMYFGGMHSKILDNLKIYGATEFNSSDYGAALHNKSSKKDITIKNSYAESYIKNEQGNMKVENGEYNEIINSDSITLGLNEEVFPELKRITNSGNTMMNYATLTSNSYVIRNTGTFTMKNGIIDLKFSNSSLDYRYAYQHSAVWNTYGIFNLENGNIKSSLMGLFLNGNSTLNMTGGKVDAISAIGSYNANINIHGGELLYNDYGIYASSGYYELGIGIRSLIDGDASIKSKNKTSGTAIYNGTGSVAIKENAVIEGSKAIDLYDYEYSPTLTLGEKDGEVNINYPKIKGNIGISDYISSSNSYNRGSSKTNFYDGRIISEEAKQLNFVSDAEDNYELTYEKNAEDETLEDLYLGDGDTDVAEINGIKYRTIKKAFDAANEMSESAITIKLLKNVKTIEKDITTNENKNITFDLNGFNIEIKQDKNYFINNGNLKLVDSTALKTDETFTLGSSVISSYRTSFLENNGELQIDAGTYKIEKRLLTNSKKAVINNGNFTQTLRGINDYRYSIYNNESATITINNGNITKNYEGVIIHNESSSENAVVINGGNLSGTSMSAIESEVGIITINNGTTSSTGVIECKKECTSIINGGRISGGIILSENAKATIKDEIKNDTYVSAINNSASTVDIKNGTIGRIFNKDSGIINVYNGKVSTIENNSGNTTIYNGIFKNSSSSIRNESTMIIYGGEFECTSADEVIGNFRGNLTILGGEIKNTNNPDLIYTPDKYDNAAINNTGTLTLGTKGKANETDENVVLNVPKISSNKYCTIINKGTARFNYYDGTLIGPENYVICDTVNEIEDKYSMKKETLDGMTTVTLELSPVARVGSKDYYSLEEAFTDSTCEETSGCTIEIMQDIARVKEEIIEVNNNQNITLDLNGHTITSEHTLFKNNGEFKIDDSTKEEKDGIKLGTGIINISNEKLIINNENAKLTIDSGNFVVGREFVENNGELIINNGKIERLEGIVDTRSTMNYLITNGLNAKLEINGGSIENSTRFMSSNSYYYGVNLILNNSIREDAVIINGGNLYSISDDYSWNRNSIDSNSGVITFNNGTLRGNFYINENSILNIHNGTITSAYRSALVINKGEANIHNVKSIDDVINISGLLNIYNGKVNNVYNSKENPVTNIYNGNLNIVSTSHWSYSKGVNGTINIYGGKIEGSNSIENTASNTLNIGTKGDLKDGNLNVSTTSPEIINNYTSSGSSSGYAVSNSGTFNFYDGVLKSKYSEAVSGKITTIEDSYRLKKEKTDEYNEIYYLVREPIVEVNGTNYYSINEALESSSCTSSCTIKYIDEYITTGSEETVEVSSGKNITLDINGNNVIVNNDKFMVNNGTLKVIDTAEVKGEILAKNGVNIIENNSSLEIDGANLKHLSSTIGAPVVNNSNLTVTSGLIQGIDNPAGKTIINGGEIRPYFDNVGGTWISINNRGTGTLEVNAGKLITENCSTSVIVNNSTGVIDGTTSSLVINDGELSATCANTYYSNRAITATSGVTINGGSLKAANVFSTNGSVNNGAIFNINGGEYQNIGGSSVFEFAVNNGSEFEVNIKDTSVNTGGTLINVNVSSSSKINLNLDNVNLTGTTPFYLYNDDNKSLITINNSVINGSSKGIEIQRGTINLNNTVVTGTTNVIDNSGTLNINDGSVSGGNIGINNLGILNIGTKGKLVDTDASVVKETPLIEGSEYGVQNTGIMNLYDGVLKGQIGKSYSGVVNEVEPGYLIRRVEEEEREKTIFELIGTENRTVGLPDYNLNFNDLQSAINSVTDGIETTMYLYQSITLDKDIVVPNGKNIRFYYNGNTINKNGFAFTIEDGAAFTEVDNGGISLLGQILDLLNIGKKTKIVKNIVIYELDNGDKLNSVKEYKLQILNEGKYIDVDVKEKLEDVGRYTVSSKRSDETLRTINGNIYINNLPNGDYRLVESENENNNVIFSIEKDGKINGNVKENYQSKEINAENILSMSSANVILNIQTGQKIIRYGLIFIVLSSIILSLVILRKKLRN